MDNPPSGTVTFLFTDIEGSTKLAQQYPDERPTLLARHHEILRQAVQAQNGYIFQNDGDSLAVAFHSAIDAVNAALSAQHILQKEAWSPAPIKVRMGLHTGTAQLNDASAPTVYTGYATIALTQRIMSAGHGGQILLSSATRELVRDALPAETELQDMGEKRLKDLSRPEHLYQLNGPGLLSSFAALKTLDSFPNNLPTQLTTFIGRENEIAEVKQALAEHRLVTLTGSGGAGKSRLSLQVAAELLDHFPNGIWFVELAPLTDPNLIAQTILTAADMQPRGGKSALESLIDFLREKTCLLVLDNCEHLLDACARLGETLLSAAPHLKILASSREAFGIRGEQSWHVPSLAVPDLKHLPPVEQLLHYDAVRLFMDRALLVQPHFSITSENASAVAQICHTLDGIPLAIELAASRVWAEVFAFPTLGQAVPGLWSGQATEASSYILNGITLSGASSGLGMILFGASTVFSARIYPRWAGALLIVSIPVIIVLNGEGTFQESIGPIMLGIAVGALGFYALRIAPSSDVNEPVGTHS